MLAIARPYNNGGSVNTACWTEPYDVAGPMTCMTARSGTFSMSGIAEASRRQRASSPRRSIWQQSQTIDARGASSGSSPDLYRALIMPTPANLITRDLSCWRAKSGRITYCRERTMMGPRRTGPSLAMNFCRPLNRWQGTGSALPCAQAQAPASASRQQRHSRFASRCDSCRMLDFHVLNGCFGLRWK